MCKLTLSIFITFKYIDLVFKLGICIRYANWVCDGCVNWVRIGSGCWAWVCGWVGEGSVYPPV